MPEYTQERENGRDGAMHAEPISPQELKRARHKYEKPFYVICVIITLSLMLAAVSELGDLAAGFSDGLSEDAEAAGDGLAGFASQLGEAFTEMAFGEEEGGSGTAYANEGEAEEDDESYLAVFLALPFVILFWLYLYYAQTRAYAIRVSERNFPEIYHKSVEYSKALGLKKVPAVYIEQQNGILNAFAAAIVRKRYIMLNAELVDIAYMEHKDFDTVFFVLAHEFGHQYWNHVTFSYNFWTMIPHIIPVFGFMHLRSMEYTCDRVAQLLLRRDCVQEAMVLSAGRHLYKYVDTQDYLQTAVKEKGLFLWFVNMMTTHPITPKRISALADPQKRSGRLLWGNTPIIR